MNLIVNRRLGSQEELAIYELTLKKQRSKRRSNVSDKQVAAMQQLAQELLHQRKQFTNHLDDANTMRNQLSIPLHERDPSLCRCQSTGSLSLKQPAPSQAARQEKPNETQCTNGACQPNKDLQRQSSTSSVATDSTGASTSSASNSSASSFIHLKLHHCPSSASSLQQQVALAESHATKGDSFASASSESKQTIPDEASIELNKLRLKQLNSELESRLHQYEYLVAQEKAILHAHHLELFTNKGVNNFKRFDVHHEQQRLLHASQSCVSFHSLTGGHNLHARRF